MKNLRDKKTISKLCQTSYDAISDEIGWLNSEEYSTINI